MTIKQQLTTLFFSLSVLCFSQTKESIEKITNSYDIEKIQQKGFYFKSLEDKEKAKAIRVAKEKGWPILIKEDDGSIKELMKLTPDGFPLYYSTSNLDAAISTRTNHINSGGSLGLNLNGQNMTARVWDGGTVRRSHTLFSNRVTTVDDPTGETYSTHATHVTGTIMASNASEETKGMAYQANARTFDWSNDLSEAFSEVLLGMLVSNHSYGIPLNSAPSWYVGTYSTDAKIWDELAYNAPFYLMVTAAGNDGNNENGNPIETGYDKLTGNKVAKNNLVIANANDATIAEDGTLLNVTINSSSSQGPTDDRRIKPDLTGNGTGLTSTTANSNNSTGSLSGTSMASPNVAGTLLLLQQHFQNLTTSFMKAATLKGLACHTADDGGNLGPDAKFGWGLLNAKKAVETINNNGLSSWISEEKLHQNETFSFSVISNGGFDNPLIASITWTDVPGEANNGQRPVNDETPALVNDLDIRITKDDITYYPWKLQANPSDLAIRTEDNNVDNIEQIKIDFPDAGEYLITVTHKGNLVTDSQFFSLIVTGISSDFAIISNSEDLIICDNENPVFTFNYKQIGAGTTTFSAVEMPSGTSADFNPSSLSSDGIITMTVFGSNNLLPGNYNVGIKGDNGVETEIRMKQFRVYSNTFNPVVLISPSNEQNTISTTTLLNWDENLNAEVYTVQISTTPDFTSLFLNNNTTNTNYLATNLNEETIYYWRVIPSNRCGEDLIENATVFSFETGKLTCGFVYQGTDFSDAIINTTVNSIATVPVEVTGGLLIGDINVSINITHTYIEDITIYLEGPASIGSPTVILFKEPCGNNDDINCTLDDTGSDFVCNPSPPGISGTVKPFENLSGFNNLIADGTWVLRVVDAYNGDGGFINDFTLSICNIEEALSVADYPFSSIKIYPNPSKGILNIDLENDNHETIYTLYDIQGRLILNKKSNNSSEKLNLETFSNGIYMLTIENKGSKMIQKIILNN